MNVSTLTEKALADLAAVPELALNEQKTKAYILDFLREHTTLEVHDEGAFIYAAHREQADETIAFRADIDAVPTATGPAHLCGHNGHTAALLGLALLIEGKRLGRSVILLFQPAEETGAGAPVCAPLFKKECVSLIIGAHNIPGEPMGCVLLRRGAFACASCGLDISMKGAPAHAAYPENGLNPTAQLARLALDIPAEAERLQRKHSAMTLATVVGMRTGERAFGVAASEGSLWVTLRSESAQSFEELTAFAVSHARAIASDARLELSIDECDPFPATVNPVSLVERAEAVCRSENLPYKYLPVPFRWSEDFGHYAACCPALFIGVGSGEAVSPLHTASYSYPAGLAERTAEVFLKLISI